MGSRRKATIWSHRSLLHGSYSEVNWWVLEKTMNSNWFTGHFFKKTHNYMINLDPLRSKIFSGFLKIPTPWQAPCVVKNDSCVCWRVMMRYMIKISVLQNSEFFFDQKDFLDSCRLHLLQTSGQVISQWRHLLTRNDATCAKNYCFSKSRNLLRSKRFSGFLKIVIFW